MPLQIVNRYLTQSTLPLPNPRHLPTYLSPSTQSTYFLEKAEIIHNIFHSNSLRYNYYNSTSLGRLDLPFQVVFIIETPGDLTGDNNEPIEQDRLSLRPPTPLSLSLPPQKKIRLILPNTESNIYHPPT